jgi:hypothetical protein
MGLWKSVTHKVPPADLPSGGLAEEFDHGAYLGDGFGRGTQERDQTLPRVLPDHSQPPIFFDGLVNDRVPVDLFINCVQVFIQSEKSNQEWFFNTLKENGFSFLPYRKNPIRRLNDVGIEDLGKPKKLTAFQGVLK